MCQTQALLDRQSDARRLLRAAQQGMPADWHSHATFPSSSVPAHSQQGMLMCDNNSSALPEGNRPQANDPWAAQPAAGLMAPQGHLLGGAAMGSQPPGQPTNGKRKVARPSEPARLPVAGSMCNNDSIIAAYQGAGRSLSETSPALWSAFDAYKFQPFPEDAVLEEPDNNPRWRADSEPASLGLPLYRTAAVSRNSLPCTTAFEAMLADQFGFAQSPLPPPAGTLRSVSMPVGTLDEQLPDMPTGNLGPWLPEAPLGGGAARMPCSHQPAITAAQVACMLDCRTSSAPPEVLDGVGALASAAPAMLSMQRAQAGVRSPCSGQGRAAQDRCERAFSAPAHTWESLESVLQQCAAEAPYLAEESGASNANAAWSMAAPFASPTLQLAGAPAAWTRPSEAACLGPAASLPLQSVQGMPLLDVAKVCNVTKGAVMPPSESAAPASAADASAAAAAARSCSAPADLLDAVWPVPTPGSMLLSPAAPARIGPVADSMQHGTPAPSACKLPALPQTLPTPEGMQCGIPAPTAIPRAAVYAAAAAAAGFSAGELVYRRAWTHRPSESLPKPCNRKQAVFDKMLHKLNINRNVATSPAQVVQAWVQDWNARPAAPPTVSAESVEESSTVPVATPAATAEATRQLDSAVAVTHSVAPPRAVAAPRAAQVASTHSRMVANRLSLQMLQDEGYLDMPINEAAKKLGLGLSALKRTCRSLGLARWPFRTRQGLRGLIQKSEAYLDDEAALDYAGGRKADVVTALRAHLELPTGEGGSAIPMDIKKYRQKIFKMHYKVRNSS